MIHRIYASTVHKNQKIILPIYDEISVKKTERKKIQILVSGEYKKGIFNNENSVIYQQAKKFFDKNGFSFGIEINITKNIPGEIGASGFSEEIEYQKFLDFSLNEFSGKNRSNSVETNCNSSPLEKPKIVTPDKNISLILFPRYTLPENFLDQSLHYRNNKKFSAHDFILESFYEVQKKFLDLEIKQKNSKISEFGFIGNSPNIWVRNT